ncbi:DNA mismatch repair protein MutL [Panus rudis PR-1116 ss-1]|nr:DNA mismatch repair protein MutL [Panus rudis PR-1116 ss-1]
MADRDSSPPPPGPQPIRRLQESVINRIAAGEIIHRPSFALKELIENSLDAGSTSIKITVKDGGMKLLQIQDNGCGIRKSDLPILAERFTTSKISTFSDLSKLTTYGFRGEALASISYVSNLTVVTKTKSDNCAWKACYSDGRLVPARDGSTADPKACAGNDGTTITVENLFYNTPTRLSALRGSSEEYARILDVVQKYAIHNPNVSFVCKKAGYATPDVSTPAGSDTKQAIRLIYGQTIGKDLLHAKVSSEDESGEDTVMDDEEDGSWSAEAYFTSANYQSKKMVFLLFINHRLVESLRIKKALEAIYVGVLPKGMSPFMYLSLELDPERVDVNVHPTKREVRFLDEEAIIQKISDKLQNVLVSRSQSRVFEYQTLLTGGIASSQAKGKQKEREVDSEEQPEESGPSTPSTSIPKKALPQHKVRTSTKDRTLDSMFPKVNSSQIVKGADATEDEGERPETVRRPSRSTEIKESECFLTSVRTLREAVHKVKHHQLTDILQNHIFVGIVDRPRCLSLIQHAKDLYLVNHGALSEELFYQLGLRQFGNFNRIRLEPPPPIRTLVTLAVDAEEGAGRGKLTKPQIVDKIVDILISRREMLKEYFAMTISADGLLQSIPLLLKDYTPNLDKLPMFLMRLGPQVDWTSEMECFETFLRELAFFYVPEPLLPDESDDETTDAAIANADEEAARWQIQHAIFPAIAKYLVPPKSLLDRDVVQVASLPDLYRVFERC